MEGYVTVRFARKPTDLHEVQVTAQDADSETSHCAIAETAELTAGAYDAFTRLMWKNYHWLDGRGGYKNLIRQVVAVTAPGRPILYVDPSGSAYGRYVGLAISEPTPN